MNEMNRKNAPIDKRPVPKFDWYGAKAGGAGVPAAAEAEIVVESAGSAKEPVVAESGQEAVATDVGAATEVIKEPVGVHAATEAEVVESAESGKEPVTVGAGIHVAPEVIAVVRNDKLSLREKLEKLKHLMSAHPLATVYPLMSDDEIEALVQHIKTNGQRVPILVTNGKILDGRNRWLACVLAGVQPQASEWDKQGDPIDVVEALNSMRREIAPFQRAAVAVNMIPHYEAQARKRQEEAGAEGGRRNTLGVKPTPRVRDDSKRSVVQAAKASRAGISATQMLRKVKETAPEVFELALDGKVNQAATKWLTALPEPERKEAVARILNGEKLAKPIRPRKPSPPVSETALDLIDRAETLIQQASPLAPNGAMASRAKQVVMILGEMRSLAQPAPAAGSTAPVATATVKTGSSKTRSGKTGSSKTRSGKTGSSKTRSGKTGSGKTRSGKTGSGKTGSST